MNKNIAKELKEVKKYIVNYLNSNNKDLDDNFLNKLVEINKTYNIQEKDFFLNNIFNFIEKSIKKDNEENNIKIIFIINNIKNAFYNDISLIKNILLNKDDTSILIFKKNFELYLDIFFSLKELYFKENNFIKLEWKIDKIKAILEENKKLIDIYNNEKIKNKILYEKNLTYKDLEILEQFKVKEVQKLLFILHNIANEYQKDKYIGYVRFNWNQELKELKIVLIKYIILIYSKIILEIEQNKTYDNGFIKIIKYLTLLVGFIFIYEEEIIDILNYVQFFNNKFILKYSFSFYENTTFYLYPLNLFIASLFTVNNIKEVKKDILFKTGIKIEDFINFLYSKKKYFIKDFYSKKIFKNNKFCIIKFCLFENILINSFLYEVLKNKNKGKFFNIYEDDIKLKTLLKQKLKLIKTFIGRNRFIKLLYSNIYKDINIKDFPKLKLKKDLDILIFNFKKEFSDEELFYLIFEFES